MSLNSNKKCLVLGFPESYEQARELAELAGISYADIEIHKFPDGESKVTLPADLIKSCKHIIIYRSLDKPNEKLIELLLAAEGIKSFGGIQINTRCPIPGLYAARQGIQSRRSRQPKSYRKISG